jgi:hypothetical protein
MCNFADSNLILVPEYLLFALSVSFHVSNFLLNILFVKFSLLNFGYFLYLVGSTVFPDTLLFLSVYSVQLSYLPTVVP